MDQNTDTAIRIKVDPANPGQFFACCGLLELADRLWGFAEGWFGDELFYLNADGSLAELLQCLIKSPPVEIARLDNGLSVKPLIAPIKLMISDAPPKYIILDSWMCIMIDKGKIITAANPPWNFWSGQQTSIGIWKKLRDALLKQMKQYENYSKDDLFNLRIPLTGRFGFDPAAAWHALDIGFSPNEQSIPVASSPLVEMLAAIGLQRFRPLVFNHRKSFIYSTWGQPLSVSVASAAATESIFVSPAVKYHGHVIDRGSYAALDYSNPL